MNHQCPICLDPALIPVEILAFPCSKNNSIHCFSFQRMCEKCAINVLELNRPPAERSEDKKCLFCDARINLRHIFDKPYKKDFLLMSADESLYNCPYCEFQGKQIEINHHLDTQCQRRSILCLCGMINDFQFIESHEHLRQCPFFAHCLICNEYIPSATYESHLLSNHSMLQCRACQKPTSLSITEHLTVECPHRMVHCYHCNKKYTAFSYLDHLIEHTKESITRIELLKDILSKEYEIYYRYRAEIQESFEKTFGTSLHLN